MRKSLARTLYLISLVAIIGGLALAFSGATLSSTTNSLGGTTSTISSVNNPALVIAGLVALIIGFVLYLVAWIGSLVKVAQLQRWGWFVGVLLVSTIGLLIYVFAGPTTPKNDVTTYPSQ